MSASTKTPLEQLKFWMSLPRESARLEFKEAKNTFEKSKLNEHCVAIANAGGGHLVLGVTDKLPRMVVSTSAFQNLETSAHELFDKLGFRVDIEELKPPEGRVLVFHIPPRPSGSAYHLDGKYLMRSGESLVPMSEDKLRSIFAEGKPDWLDEVTKSNLSPQEVVEALDLQTYFSLLKLPFPTTQDAVLEKLQNDKLVEKSGELYSLKRITALLLAKRLDDFPELERKAARVLVYSGVSKVQTKLDQVAGLGFAVGFQRLVQFVMSQLPQNEVIRAALRQEVKLVPEIVIREFVANALVHQDFSVSGASVLVEIYTNRVEISNPGEPIVPIDRFIDGNESRNERLAMLFRKMGICEEKGSGVDKCIFEIEANQLPPPDFRKGYRTTIVTIQGH